MIEVAAAAVVAQKPKRKKMDQGCAGQKDAI